MPDEARAPHVQGRAIASLAGRHQANIEHSRLRVAVPEALAPSHAAWSHGNYQRTGRNKRGRKVVVASCDNRR